MRKKKKKKIKSEEPETPLMKVEKVEEGDRVRVGVKRRLTFTKGAE